MTEKLLKYKHFKEGGIYTVICEGLLESNLKSMVVYESQDGEVWIRPSVEFYGYKDGMRRFKPIKEA